MKITGILARMRQYQFKPDYNDLLEVQEQTQELVDALRVITKYADPTAAKVAQAALDRVKE